MDDSSKNLLGEYTLHEQLGAGGMGVVYRATHSRLQRKAAIKLIRGGVSSPERITRFEVEARAVAKLDHRGIVPIYEIGVAGDQHFLALAYIEGETLAHRIARGPLSAEEAATLLRKICAAVSYAHNQGVIHRDLKPANILLDKNGEPHITDFGLARLENENQALTIEGDIFGTPGYMAPEQCAGLSDEIGPVTDVYALGAVLFSMLTGFPPFQGATARKTVAQVLEREANSPRLLNSEIPRDLEAICLKCLQKDFRQRYASAADLVADLRAFIEGDPIAARPSGFLHRATAFVRHESRNPQCGLLIFALSLVLCCITLVAVDERRAAHLKIQQDVREIARNLDLIHTKWRRQPKEQFDKDANIALHAAKDAADNASFRGEMLVSGAMIYLLLNFFLAVGGFYGAWRLWTQSPTIATTLWTALVVGVAMPLLIIFGIGVALGGKGLQIALKIPIEIASTTLGALSLTAGALMGVCCVVALMASRANRERFEFRRLGSRHRLRIGTTLLAARFGRPKIAVYVVMVPLSLIALAGAFVFFINLLGEILFPIMRLEFILIISAFLALSLVGEYILASKTIWAVTQEGTLWKLVTRAGATLESPFVPTCYRISFGEAFLFEVSYTLLGGRVDQNLRDTNYWIILHRGQRYLFYARVGVELSKVFSSSAPAISPAIDSDPFASTIVKPGT
jgi:hypothetical protein